MAFKYNLNHDFRGTALIIGNEFKGQKGERLGCQEDVRMMKEVFGKLDFNVTTFMNLTAAKMKEKLEKASKDKNNKISDCFVFGLSTHGGEERPEKTAGVPPGANVWRHGVFGEDGDILFVDEIIDYFTDSKAVGLAGKPKLFFLQACRSRSRSQHLPSPGDKYDQGAEVNVSSEVQGLTEKLKATSVSKDSADLVHLVDLTDVAEWVHSIDLKDAEDIYKDWVKDPEEWDPEKATRAPGLWAYAACGFSEEYAKGRSDGIEMPPSSFDLVPIKCPDDFLIIYPVMPGKYAFRNPVGGSFFIQFLHKGEHLTKLLHGCNVLQYLTQVCQDMALYTIKPYLSNISIIRDMMFDNIKYLSRKDNQDMLVLVIGKAHEKELRGDVTIVEQNLKHLIRSTLTEQQMADILNKILPFKMTACLLHRLRGNVVFQPKRGNTPMGKLKESRIEKGIRCIRPRVYLCSTDIMELESVPMCISLLTRK